MQKNIFTPFITERIKHKGIVVCELIKLHLHLQLATLK